MTHRNRKESKLSPAMVSVALQDSISRQIGLNNVSEGKRGGRRSGCLGCGKIARHAKGKKEREGEKARDMESLMEYVLDPVPPPLTLAQRHGLAPVPPPLLTEDQWEEVKRCSQSRGDFIQPCPICQDEFKMKEQVLLSCSHSFHRVCLSSFERYSGRKCCPLCRAVHYQTRVIHTAASLHRHKCATKIQAAWRGYLVRKWYTKYREHVPPKHPQLREKHFERKLTHLTDVMVQCCDASSQRVDKFLSSLEREVESARCIMSMVDAHTTQASSNQVDWQEVQSKALTTDCVICISSLSTPSSRQLSLLSCGHILHTSCITSFEQFTTTSSTLPSHQCPICRSIYRRQQFIMQDNLCTQRLQYHLKT